MNKLPYTNIKSVRDVFLVLPKVIKKINEIVEEINNGKEETADKKETGKS